MLRYCQVWVVLFCFAFKIVSPQCQVAQTCVTDITVDDCWGSEVLVPNSNIFGCCPSCGIPSVEDGQEAEGCKAPANCLPDGRYAPVQCKGNLFTGRCFCSDEHGNRIFGQMWRDEADEMTCACSRRRAELEAEGKVVTLHCTANGDYEQLQCDDGMCWCAQPRTGQPIVTPVPEEDMTRLPCYATTGYTQYSRVIHGLKILSDQRQLYTISMTYDKEPRYTCTNTLPTDVSAQDSAAVMGEQYLRKCESLVHATSVIAREQSEHGTNFLGNPVTFCDYDGSYGPYQIQNGIAYCTGRDGNILGAWQIISSEMAGMNCNCARDTMMYFPERGMMVTETCQANGNYQPNQNVGDVYYCVDTDGYHIELLDEWPADRCASYA